MTNRQQLVLSLFPGLGMLDHPFAEAGYSVVRGPDLMWQGDIRKFHVPSGCFAGVIGGPPCQSFSNMRHLVRHSGLSPRFGDLTPEFARIIREARPYWWIMENVPQAPKPDVGRGYSTHAYMLSDHACGGLTKRKRLIVFGIRAPVADWPEPINAPVTSTPYPTVISNSNFSPGGPGHGEQLTIDQMLERQGFPSDFITKHCGLTKAGQRRGIANGVPLAIGREIVRLLQCVLAKTTKGTPCRITKHDKRKSTRASSPRSRLG